MAAPTGATELMASVFEQLAYGSENATWRNVFLTGMQELRGGIQSTPISGAGIAPAMTIT